MNEQEQLAAAAPKLLAALQLAKDMFIANDMDLPNTMGVIDAAIELATGKQNERID